MVRLTDNPDMTLDVYHGRKTTIQQQQKLNVKVQDFVHADADATKADTGDSDIALPVQSYRQAKNYPKPTPYSRLS